jgi:pyrophosphatase PpaX
MNLKYLLLDWDGCLADTLSVWMKAYKELYKKYSIETTTEEIIKKSWGNWEEGPKNLGVKNYKKYAKELVEQVGKELPTVELHSHVYETLEDLKKQRMKMAIVTSSKRQLVEPAVRYNKLDKLIDVIVTEEEVTKRKPDPEILFKALEKLGNRDVEQSIIVGDSAKDVLAGKAAGMETVLYFPKANEKFYDKRELLGTKPDHFIEDFSELKTLIS